MIIVNPLTSVVTIPKADTIFLLTDPVTGYEIRAYDEYALMRELGDWSDSDEGITQPYPFSHETESDLSGVTYSRKFKMLAPYTLLFENGTYQVRLEGGTNNNVVEVLRPNSVSLIPANSAGKQTVATGSGVTAQDKLDIAYLSRDTLLSTESFP